MDLLFHPLSLSVSLYVHGKMCSSRLLLQWFLVLFQVFVYVLVSVGLFCQLNDITTTQGGNKKNCPGLQLRSKWTLSSMMGVAQARVLEERWGWG